MIKEYAKIDSRIVLLFNDVNSGLAYSLNRGINIAKGEYIARMDSDDYAITNRFEEQLNYLEHNKDIDIIGTFAELFGDATGYSFSPLVDKEYCRCQIIFTPCLIHPSVMIRKSFLIDNNLFYDERFRCSQDFDMWARSSLVGNICMLDKVLLKYRIHNRQISAEKKELQKSYAIEICKRQLEEIGICANKREMTAQLVICEKEPMTSNNVRDVIQWARKIVEYNLEASVHDPIVLRKVVFNRIFNLLLKCDINRPEKIKWIFSTRELRSIFNVYTLVKRVVYLARFKIECLVHGRP